MRAYRPHSGEAQVQIGPSDTEFTEAAPVARAPAAVRVTDLVLGHPQGDDQVQAREGAAEPGAGEGQMGAP